jgi:2Fe-2S ferredoxin
MATITYIEADGTEHRIDVAVGLTVMEGAQKHGIPGILADCGGNCACATCRVFVDEAWRRATGEPSEIELAMLEVEDEVLPGERLSCQLQVSPALDGLVVRLPKAQF